MAPGTVSGHVDQSYRYAPRVSLEIGLGLAWKNMPQVYRNQNSPQRNARLPHCYHITYPMDHLLHLRRLLPGQGGQRPPQRSHQPSVDSGPASCGQESWRLLFILSGKTLVGARHMACLIKAA